MTNLKEKPIATPKPSRSKRKKTPKNFKDAYDILKSNANTLQQHEEPDIDNLMTTVEESIIAYKICQERINAVQQALDATFSSTPSANEKDDETKAI